MSASELYLLVKSWGYSMTCFSINFFFILTAWLRPFLIFSLIFNFTEVYQNTEYKLYYNIIKQQHLLRCMYFNTDLYGKTAVSF